MFHMILSCEYTKSYKLLEGFSKMGSWTDSSGIHIDTRILASDFAAVANYYRQ